MLESRAAGVCVGGSSVIASATSVSAFDMFETLFWSGFVCVCFVRRRLSRCACHIRVWLSGSSSETESSRDLQSLASNSGAGGHLRADLCELVEYEGLQRPEE